MPRVHTLAKLLVIPGLAFALSACAQPDSGTVTADNGEPEPMEDNSPGLRVGDQAPDVALLTRDGQAVSLAALYADGPVVVTFYRGGWCPYCTKALAEWEGRTTELDQAGASLIAITPEAPAHAVETAAKHQLGFDVYSDHTMAAAEAFRLGFALDETTQSKYKGYGIDLASHNAAGTWQLPAPGTFVIDRDGVIRYAWAQWDYTVRADPDQVLEAVRAID